MYDAADPSPGPVTPNPLLTTKLFVPRQRPNLVSRQELVARLDAALLHPLTLVSAPAGFGKTTLVSNWVRTCALPVAWLALDAADNDPVRFLRYLLATLQQIAPAIGQEIWSALESSGPPPLEVALAAIVNDVAALDTGFVLVLDDLQTIETPAVHAALQALVAHQPAQMHLVIVTREDPVLPLARLRARGEMVELRAHDLRFTHAEAAAFLNETMQLGLDPTTIGQIDDQIEGWIAGLQLAALSMQHRPDPGAVIAAISGSHHFILSYLTEEVLRGLAPDVERFLLETAVLTRMTGALCDAVTGRTGSDALLETLYTSNLFLVPLDDEHRWYRYHHLFADLLHSRLQQTEPALMSELNVRASAWYEAQGEAGEAIEHALAAPDYPRAVRLLELHARQVVLHGNAQTVEKWLHRLPPAWRAAGPRANLAFAWSLLLRGRVDEIESYLAHAERAADEARRQGDETSAAAIQAEALALRAGMVSLQGDTARACALAEEGVRLAPPGDPYVRGATLFCLGTAYNYAGRSVEAITSYRDALPLCRQAGNQMASMLIVSNLTVLYIARGQLHASAALCRQVIEASTAAGAPPSPAVATVYGAYSQVLLEWNELDAARRQAEHALNLSKRGGHVAAIAYGSTILSRIVRAQGDLTAAAAILQEALPLAARGMPSWVAPHLVAEQVALALAQDDLAGAHTALAQSGTGIADPTSHTREVIHIAYLRLLRHTGRTAPRPGELAEALALAGRVLASAEAADRMGRVLETLILRSSVYEAMGDGPAAQKDLRAALTLAESEGYIRLFVDEGASMRAGLARLREELLQPSRPAELATSIAYVDRLLAALPVEPPSAAPPLRTATSTPIESLTEREIEVLRLMAEGLTYEEAAQRLVVSLNTIRFHVKGIYGKLGVDRRTAAIEQARTLGLL